MLFPFDSNRQLYALGLIEELRTECGDREFSSPALSRRTASRAITSMILRIGSRNGELITDDACTRFRIFFISILPFVRDETSHAHHN
jgi:hypothetical protein